MKRTREDGGKRPYRAPRLVVYGDLRKIVQFVGTTKGGIAPDDSLKPRTRLKGPKGG